MITICGEFPAILEDALKNNDVAFAASSLSQTPITPLLVPPLVNISAFLLLLSASISI